MRAALGLVRAAAVLALFAGIAHAAVAHAADPADATDRKLACAVPPALEFSGVALPHVEAALKAHAPVRIVVIGSGSSTGVGVSAPANAYPERLVVDLAARIPGAKVEIANLSRRGMLASEMARMFPKQVEAKHPALVIWQTGTVDAVQGVDVGSFGQTLADGIQALQDHGADVILMNMQYSPLTATALNIGRYIDYMRWLAQTHSAVLFDRYSIMKYWEESNAIDISAAAKADQTRDDDFVHACLARLLSDVIATATATADATASAPKP